MRILCHAQHLSGVGHFVRMHAIARGLSATHEVHLVDGGRPVPHEAGEGRRPELVRLPPLARSEGRLLGVGTTAPVRAVLEERARTLGRAVERIRPDVVLVDHYPFSKWELEPEIGTAIDAARRCNPRVRVLCSLRDVVRKTRYEDLAQDAYEARVLSLLRSRFDGILVHADPSFSRLEDHFGRGAGLPLPVRYTGFVGEAPRPAPPPSEPYAVLSCGGGTRSLPFLLAAIGAFRRLSSAGALGRMALHVFPGPFPTDPEAEALRAAARDGPIELRAFSSDFGRWLRGGVLSISRAGYNTTVQLLGAGVRAVVVPDAGMSDQGWRAQRLAELELATVAGGTGVEAIAAAIEAALARALPRHGFDLDGVAGSRRLVEEAGWSSTDTFASRSTRA